MTKLESIQVFGSGCPTCKTLHQRAVQAVSELGLPVQVEYVTDIQRIIDLGMLQSPVLAINGQPVIVGYVPDVEHIKQTIQEKIAA